MSAPVQTPAKTETHVDRAVKDLQEKLDKFHATRDETDIGAMPPIGVATIVTTLGIAAARDYTERNATKKKDG